MNRRWLASLGVILILGVLVGAAQQPDRRAVLVRDPDNRLTVSSVVATPGDRVLITDGQIIVNGRWTGLRVQGVQEWGPQVVPTGAYFVAGDPARLGVDPHAWGLIPQERIVGTVQIGSLPE